MTPQLSLRVAGLGGLALLMFSVIFFRLWYLEVLSGDRYVEEANNNRVREIRVQPPRGKILDRDGSVLVDNRTGLALQVQPDRLPENRSARAAVIRRLSKVADMRPKRVRREIRRQLKELPYSAVTLRQDIDYDKVYYVQENQAAFPGVRTQRVFLRRYPEGTLAAHLFGNVGEVTRKQLRDRTFNRLGQGDVIGQSGIEYEYDRFLRGQSGATRIQVDARGRPKGELDVRRAVPGRNLRLTVDPTVQRAGEQALASFGKPGGFVAMDVQTGEILGLGSYPTFDPGIFTKRLTKSTYRSLTSKANGAPLANRAIQGLYPTGSTFKLITAVAALQGGLITPETPINDSGKLKIDTITFKNANDAVFGTISLRRALQVSSDIFFYKLGQMAEGRKGKQLIQTWAARLGFGRRTGIDLPSELDGLIPTREWRNGLFREKKTDRPWTIGDNVNFAVGQGDLQANPLQMAVAYAAVGNGGEVVRPHLAERVEDSSGRTLQEIKPQPLRKVQIKPENRQAIMDGLRSAAMDPGGTSYEVFGAWPIDIAGKTGTAERGNQGDQSWYMALAPADKPRIVVAVTIERGGFGAKAAAPAADRILADYFHVSPDRPKDIPPPPGNATKGE